MGKWTERLAAQPAEAARANSAISASRSAPGAFGTNGTNGTAGPSEAEQVAFDETAGAIEYDYRQPRSVAEAVASLAHMPTPAGVQSERWRQMVADAVRFAQTHWAEAEAKGWTVLEVFGVSPGFARRLDRDGLVTLLYGREVGEITADCIAIGSGRDVVRLRRGKGSGAVTLWEAAHGER